MTNYIRAQFPEDENELDFEEILAELTTNGFEFELISAHEQIIEFNETDGYLANIDVLEKICEDSGIVFEEME